MTSIIKFELGFIILIDNGYSNKFAGGIRIKKMNNDDDAIEECTSLAYSMFLKNKKANIKFSGCKILLNIEPSSLVDKQKAIYNLASILVNLNQRIVVGNDLNFTNDDLLLLREYMIKIDETNKNIPIVLDNKISISTAYGIYGGLKAINAQTVLLQGIGSVGIVLLDLLVNDGIKIHVYDIDISKYKNDNLNITYYENFDEFIKTPADVFSPCADGRIITPENISKLNVKYILGSANNQLDCELNIIDEKGIIYIPDYIVNCGGVFCATQISQNYFFSNNMSYDKIYNETNNYISNNILIKKIIKQYDSEESQKFYNILMGDSLNEGSIHYGIYRNSNDDIDDTLNTDTASKNSIDEIIKGVDLNGKKILDIGSGNGYTSHYLASKYNCEIVCVNICPNQNKKNREKVKMLGLEKKITIFDYDFSNLYWCNEFDIVISQEAICHANNSSDVFNCIYHSLKPDGLLLFSDLLSSGKESAFNNVNSINKLSLLHEVENKLYTCGFTIKEYIDNTNFLPINFMKMIKQIEDNYEFFKTLMGKEYIDNFNKSLHLRLENHNMIWGFFKCLKRKNNYDIYTTFKIHPEWIEKYNGINFEWYKQDKFMNENEINKIPKSKYLIVDIKDNIKIYEKNVIATLSSGKEHLKDLSCEKICVKYTITESVVDYLIGMMLMTDRNLHQIINDKSEVFNYNSFYSCSFGTHIKSKTIGIIGMGKIGQRITQILTSGWGCKVVFYSPNKKNIDNATYMSLEEVLGISDIILPLCELNKETENLLNYKNLSLTKQETTIISICRNKIFNFQDLVFFLQRRHFKYIILDDIDETYRNELLEFNNVFITNHIAYNTKNCIKNSFIEILDELIRYISKNESNI
jgi:lactate dehydrogenase-like 2-hydroxyacid dehydrogenase